MRKTELDAIAREINLATHSPVDPCSMLGGKLVHNKDYFFVDKAPGRGGYYRFRRVLNAKGVLETPLGVGPLLPPELKGLMLAFLCGITYGKQEKMTNEKV